MKKTKNWFQAVIETASNNYFIELVKKTDYKYRYILKAYTEWEEIESNEYYFRNRLKKSDFTNCILDFLNTFKIRDYSLMDY